MTLVDLLIKHEGIELKPYKCSAGRYTIGIGRNLQDCGITAQEALFLLDNDIERVTKELEVLRFTQYLNEPRKIALLDMLFNIGFPRFLKFKRMIAALEEQDYDEAALQMLDSKWATQVGNRAIELSEMIRTGKCII